MTARSARGVPAVAVVGKHNSGKTTFLLALIPILVGRGLRVGYLKHAHEGFEIDRPDKDSGRITAAGVTQTMITGGGRTAVIDRSGEQTIAQVLDRYARDDLDLIIVEGFKRELLAKIEVSRYAISRGELICQDDPQLIAVVTDFDPPRPDLARFSLDDARGVADLIWTRILRRDPVPA